MDNEHEKEKETDVMKTGYINKAVSASRHEALVEATALEKENRLEDSAKAYQKIIRRYPGDAAAYERLMIVYRKLKDYERELKTIHRAIRIFGNIYKQKQLPRNKKIAAISKSILKATGLAGEDGENIYKPEELQRWEKRKAVVAKKLGL